jgi:tetratricopeptide (TPR) repeat protein
VANLYLGQGDLRSAIALLEESRAIAEKWDLPLNQTGADCLLARAYALEGRSVDSASLLAQGAAGLASQPAGFRTRLWWLFAEVHFLLGQDEEANRAANLVLEAARQRNERTREAQILFLLGEIAARGDRPDTESALSRLCQARTLAEELGMRPLLARCHLGLGKLYRRSGETDNARRELVRALEMLREMQMQYWVPETERELSALGA